MASAGKAHHRFAVQKFDYPSAYQLLAIRLLPLWFWTVHWLPYRLTSPWVEDRPATSYPFGAGFICRQKKHG
jgi:hypothetical protein